MMANLVKFQQLYYSSAFDAVLQLIGTTVSQADLGCNPTFIVKVIKLLKSRRGGEFEQDFSDQWLSEFRDPFHSNAVSWPPEALSGAPGISDLSRRDGRLLGRPFFSSSSSFFLFFFFF